MTGVVADLVAPKGVTDLEGIVNGVRELEGPNGVVDLEVASGVPPLPGASGLIILGIGIGESGVTLRGMDKPEARCRAALLSIRTSRYCWPVRPSRGSGDRDRFRSRGAHDGLGTIHSSLAGASSFAVALRAKSNPEYPSPCSLSPLSVRACPSARSPLFAPFASSAASARAPVRSAAIG